MKPAQWLKTRKHLLDSVKGQVGARLGPPPRSLKTYAKRLDLEFRKSWQTSSLDELKRQALKSDLIFLGDFHAYYQSQRAQLRLLRELDLSQTLVFLECFTDQDAEWIDLFWSYSITEAEFVKKTSWNEIWGFPWEHYRDLILHLRERQALVRGISSGQYYSERLIHRDRKMAQIMEDQLLLHPSEKAIVIVGESHLHPSHLPEEMKRRKALNFKRQMILFQDSEELYFRYQKKIKSWDSLVLRRKDKTADEFCWNVSPPWVKWQSYLIYLEQTADQELDEEGIEADDHVRALAQWMCQDLDLSVSFNYLEVYTPTSRRDFLTPIPDVLVGELMASERSFLLDASGKIYLSRMSVNHAASVAGQYIHNRLSGRRDVFYTFPRDLERRLWAEAIGFFFSKWMNPSRKTESFETLKIRLKAIEKAARGPSSRNSSSRSAKIRSEAIMNLVADLYTRAQRTKRGLKVSPQKTTARAHPLVQLEATRFLGRVLGKALFDAVLSRQVSREELSFWLSLPLEGKDFPKTFWEGIVARVI